MNANLSPESLREFAAEPTSDQSPQLPDYAPDLDAFHRAMHQELLQILRELPVRPGDRVLDIPCGDGFYAACLAYLHKGKIAVVAADSSVEYLTLAEERVGRVLGKAPISFVRADAYELPFPADSFDLVWCAQSLVSLEDPVAVLKELRRIVRPEGTVAVLENDEFHHLLLPWPVELDLALQQALHTAGRIRYGEASRLSPGRYLRQMFLDAGFGSYRKRTWAVDRQWPLAKDDRRFLLHYFQSLRQLVYAHLGAGDAAHLDSLIDPASPQFLADQPDFDMTCLNIVAMGKPNGETG